MCFSATASFVAGASLSAVGIVTVKKARNKREIPFAAVPLLFGIQQIAEGFVWLSFKWNDPVLNTLFSHIFYFFSNIWWPFFAPLAILLIETVRGRKMIILAFEAAGIVVAGYFLSFMATSPITSKVLDYCIVYSHPNYHLTIVSVLYVLATCASCFFSSKKTVRFLGVLLVASLIIANIFYTTAVASVWCFFAAALSIVIYLYFSRD